MKKKTVNKSSIRALKTRAKKTAAKKTAVRKTATRKIHAHLTRNKLDEKQASSVPALSNEQVKTIMEKMNANITRREFIKAGALAAGAVSLPGLLAACHSKSGGSGTGATSTEKRSFVFNFSEIDTSNHILELIAGKKQFQLKEITGEIFLTLIEKHPILGHVPRAKASHYLTIDMPASGMQLCYVRRRKISVDSSASKEWDMAMEFYHTPSEGLIDGMQRIYSELGADEHPPTPNKWARFGLSAADIAEFDDPVGADSFKDDSDTAVKMVTSHPEIACGDPSTHTVISQKYVVGTSETGTLTDTIKVQGLATPQANWSSCEDAFAKNSTGYATLAQICGEDGTQATRQDGSLMYVPVYSDQTNSSASDAVVPTLQQVKDDTTLGGNITTNPDSTTGLIWRNQDGVTTSDQTDDGLGAGNGLGYTTNNLSPGHGYSAEVIGVADGNGSDVDAVVTFKVKNWYVRYLSIYARYLSKNGDTIAISDLSFNSGTINKYFPLHDCCSEWDSKDDLLVSLLGPEFEIIGIPVSDKEQTFDLPVPNNAVSIELLGSGMGNTSSGSNPYYSTTIPGSTMTGIFELSLPTMFLALNAAAGLAGMNAALKESAQMISLLPLILRLYADTFEAAAFDDPAAFESLGISIGKKLLTSGAKPLATFVVEYLTEGETTEDLLDAIPVIGGFLAMIAVIGTVAQMAETSAQVAQSPSTYRYVVSLTHDIDVVVKHDPTDHVGWPSTAVSYRVLLQFDGAGTPTTLLTKLPGGTVTADQTVTFQAVPLGGNVTVSVQVYTDSGWQVGTGSVGPFENIDPLSGERLTLDITFTEKLVPLTATTVYSHNEVIALNDSGEHVWNPTITPPTQEAQGCSPSNGQLCRLTGITINSTAPMVGQTFQSYNDAVPTCSSASSISNAHQFSNISITATPESEYFFSGCTFPVAPRLAYDLMNRPDYNFYLDTSSTGADYKSIVRQVRSGGFDGPDSDKAWGKLQFSSDVLLLHPGGQLISVNSSKNKMEVVTLPESAVSDAKAQRSQAFGGKGLREGLMNLPVLAALSPEGAVLVLETSNSRIQAFDLNANPTKRFGTAKSEYFFPLKEQQVTGTIEYLDFSVEFKGYMYVLWANDVSGTRSYTLDIYTPEGVWLSSTPEFNAQKMAVNYWRDVYVQNSQVLTLPDGSLPARTEPSISHWIPSTP